MESKKVEDIKNLLLKIVLPLAFPLAGSFISDIIRRRANRHSYTGTSDSSVQFDHPSYGSTIQEEEEQEMESTCRASRKFAQSEKAYSTADRVLIGEFSRQASNAEELLAIASSENPAEVAVSKVQDDQTTSEELATLKRLVSGLEERACSIESQFHDYCDMKEQESTYQKMQIMCLGMKLELLESQNQRLETAAVEIRAAAEEFAAMRGKLDRLQSKLKKIAKRRKQDSDAADERILALDAKQALMTRRFEEVGQCMEDMKQLTLQLEKQKGATNENVEVAVERSLQKLSSGRDLVDGLEALRDRWAADMEEMVYLGWITAWLQHDLLFCGDDAGFGTVVVGGDEDDPPEEDQKKGETMVAEVAPSNEVRLCKAASSSSSSGPPRHSVDGEPSCMGFASAGGAGRDNCGGWASDDRGCSGSYAGGPAAKAGARGRAESLAHAVRSNKKYK